MGFGDLDEVLRGGGVIGMKVWMVGFGEFIELSICGISITHGIVTGD